MKRLRGLYFLSLVFMILGTLFLLSSFSGITGFVILDMEWKGRIIGTLGVGLIVAGVLINVFERRQSGSSGLQILVSRKAIDRSNSDSKIRNNLGKYQDEIRMIAANPEGRPQEIIGDFHVSPRGGKDVRVAWHYDKQANVLYIDDFLYHKKQGTYVDKWNDKAGRGKITKQDYEKAGYEHP